MDAPPTVSIVISTYNRCDQLPIAVNACLAQHPGTPYEVIVVDNNSTDGTRRWVEARMATAGGRLRYVFEPKQGLPNARNAGIAAARGLYVAFTDDDVHVAPDWVASIARAFAQHPEVDMIGGKVLPRWPGPLPRWFSRLQWAPLALQDKGEAPMVVDAANAAPCLIGASFAFRREVFERIGAFDPAFTRAQDREIQVRLWRAKGRGLYVPDMVVWVDVPADRLTKQYFRFWYTRSGRFASRMRLLDLIDRDGRMVESPGGRELFGCPAFIYRQIVEHAGGTLRALLRRDEARAFYHENRTRFLISYAAERARRRQDLARTGPHREARAVS
jgi:glycosyltransferase involved in cell wall biosynthesis